MGQNLICPQCNGEFFATPPQASQVILPEKLPFFKFGRRKILKEKVEQLVADGELSKEDDALLSKAAIRLGLGTSDLTKIQSDLFWQEFNPIKGRIEKSFWCTDKDLEDIERLKKKYDIQLIIEGDFAVLRSVYLMEAKGLLPEPLSHTEISLDDDEIGYSAIGTTWHQARVKTHGFSGTSVSVPTGIKGVRFRFGGYTPIKSEEITPLSDGTLYVTSKRLLFHGSSRSTKIDVKKIIDAHIFTDALKIEKATGRPDYFSMDLANAKYNLTLITCLKQQR